MPPDVLMSVVIACAGASRGKRSGSPAWEVSHGAKRARHEAPEQAAAAEGDESSSSKDNSETPSDSGPSEHSWSLLPAEYASAPPFLEKL